jgi:hypothetical protein
MLSLMSMADAAVPTAVSPARARSRTGTLACARMPVPRCHVRELAGPAKAIAQPAAAMAVVRPRERTMTEIFGNGAQVAGLAMFAGQQPISKVNYAHTTRIAALKGSGALGPHPARDPV